MRHHQAGFAIFALACLTAARGEAAIAGDEVSISLVAPTADTPRSRFVVNGLPPSAMNALAKGESSDWSPWFTVHVLLDAVATSADDLPAVAGSYGVENGQVWFEPRHPLVPGMSYRARVDLGHMPNLEENDASHPRGAAVVEKVFTLPPPPPSDPTQLTAIYPTQDVLAENHLKFYLRFTAPMRRGEAYRRIHLVGEDGREIDAPFLELGEELWDTTGLRFTLFFDPGRIKRGLKPREEVGPALEAGKRYTLVVDADWKDAAGQPLVSEYRKSFAVAMPDDTPPDVARWRVAPPAARTRGELAISFDEPLDHALLGRMIDVTDPRGDHVDGIFVVADDGKSVRFMPRRAWRSGEHQLVIDADLEDLSGNSLGRPFEVDVFRDVERQIARESVTLPFKIE